MKKVSILIFGFCSFLVKAQNITSKLADSIKKTTVVSKKDTIKTEVVEIITSYTPKVTDAEKIRSKPTIKFTRNVDKQKLEYTYNSIPVASTFVPQKVKMKAMKVSPRDRLFENYVSVGGGLRTTPLFEASLHKTKPFNYEYGIKIKALYSHDPVPETLLSSSFFNGGLDLFYKHEDRLFDWTVGLDVGRKSYSWYGLPKEIKYPSSLIEIIDSRQGYTTYGFFGRMDVEESHIKNILGRINFFSDSFGTSEYGVALTGDFKSPIVLNISDDDQLDVKTSIISFNSRYSKDFHTLEQLYYNFLSFQINPKYSFKLSNFNFGLGFKTIVSYEKQLSDNKMKFFVYPDFLISTGFNDGNLIVYLGGDGDTQLNTNESLTKKNPFLAPSSTLKSTNLKYAFYSGVKGTVGEDFSYNVKFTYRSELDKPMFMIRKSYFKADGSLVDYRIKNYQLKGFDHGNSFSVLYDDVRTFQGRVELEYEFNKYLSFGSNIFYNKYLLTNEQKPWNLPKISLDVFGKYTVDKWYSGVNVFFTGERDDVLYNLSESSKLPITLKPYLDLSLNAGYHLNDIFTVYLKGNNLLNSNYERYMNYDTMGLQVIGGIIWKFN